MNHPCEFMNQNALHMFLVHSTGIHLSFFFGGGGGGTAVHITIILKKDLVGPKLF